MATWEEFVTPGNRFLFREKIYKFSKYIPIPSIHMISENGEIFSFGDGSPICEKFKLIKLRGKNAYKKNNRTI